MSPRSNFMIARDTNVRKKDQRLTDLKAHIERHSGKGKGIGEKD